MILKLDLTPKQAEQLYWVIAHNLPREDKNPAGRGIDKLLTALEDRLADDAQA